MTDVYGNTRSQLLYSQTSLPGHLLKDVSPTWAGRLSGFAHGVAEIPELVRLILENPVEMAKVLVTVGFLFHHPVFQVWYAHQLTADVIQQQRRDNPFGTNEDGHEAYAQGFYEGYFVFVVADLVLGSKGLKSVSSASQLESRLSTVASRFDDLKPLVRSGASRQTAKITRRISDGGSQRDYTRLVSELDTAGAAERVKELAEDIGPRFEDLESSHPQLGIFLQRTGDNGVNVINNLDDAFDAHRLLAAPEKVTNRIVRLTSDYGVDPSALMRVVDGGHSLERLEKLLRTKATGKWSRGTPGDRKINFNNHHADHAGEWSPPLTKAEYRSKAKTLANKRENVELYYQVGQGPSNLIVFDRTSGEFVTINTNGEIQTFMQPRQNYVSDLVQNGNAIRVDDT